MSKIKNSGLDQYGAEPFEQQQFGTAGVEGVNCSMQPPSATVACAILRRDVDHSESSVDVRGRTAMCGPVRVCARGYKQVRV